MVFGEVFQRFVERAPVAAMVNATLERVLAPERLDAIFKEHAVRQYGRELLFSSMVHILGLAVFCIHRSVHAAYRARRDLAAVSVTALYDKLQGVEPCVAQAMVRETAAELQEVIGALGAELPPPVPGLRTKILDGNCLGATEKRLEVLRETAAGALPGKSLVVYDPALGLAIDVFPCEDGHAQERALLDPVLATVAEDDLWIADRNFCTRRFLFGIWERGAFFLIRHHANLSIEPQGQQQRVGRIASGEVFEQYVRVCDKAGKEHFVRCITLRLKKPTRDGEREIRLLTNLPISRVDALICATLYADRWQIETAFQTMTVALRCEINTLGYPKAALFAFCIALLAFNALAAVRAAIRAEHGEGDEGRKQVDENLSTYDMAEDLATTHEGMRIAVADAQWEIFQRLPLHDYVASMRAMARHVDLTRYQKNKRGVKKPKPKPAYDPAHPHVSTFRLLAAYAEKNIP